MGRIGRRDFLKKGVFASALAALAGKSKGDRFYVGETPPEVEPELPGVAEPFPLMSLSGSVIARDQLGGPHTAEFIVPRYSEEDGSLFTRGGILYGRHPDGTEEMIGTDQGNGWYLLGPRTPRLWKDGRRRR